MRFNRSSEKRERTTMDPRTIQPKLPPAASVRSLSTRLFERFVKLINLSPCPPNILGQLYRIALRPGGVRRISKEFYGEYLAPYLNSLERFRCFRVFLAENVPHIDGRRSLQTALALMIPMSGKEDMTGLPVLTLPPLSAASSLLPLPFSPPFFSAGFLSFEAPFAIDVGHGKRCASCGVSQHVPR
jgi:hypothetical protein